MLCFSFLLAGGFGNEVIQRYGDDDQGTHDHLLHGGVSGLSLQDGITIRGINALRGLSRPLFVVDGVMIGEYELSLGNPLSQYQDADPLPAVGTLLGLSLHDIEKIEVLKDVSATASYGSKGANGVVVVTTSLPKDTDRRSISETSNVACTMDGHVTHNHHLSFGGAVGRTALRLSAFFRDSEGGSTHYGLNGGFENRTNKVVWFGANLNAAAGKTDLARGLAHNDDSDDYGGLASAWIQLNFTPWLRWKTQGGAALRSLSRVIWYGSDTPFGEAHKGVASNIHSRTFSYNASSFLEGDLRFSDFSLGVRAGVDISGRGSRFNTLTGNDFFMESLGGYGVSSMGSSVKPALYNFSDQLLGAFASVDFKYKETAGLSAVLKADMTDYYERPFHYYPAVNAFWKIGPVRLTAGWGMAGNSQALPLDYASYFQKRGPEIEKDGINYYYAFSHQESCEWNAGADASFWNDRLVIALKAYGKTTTDDYRICSFGDRGENFWHPAAGKVAWKGHTGVISNMGAEADVDGVIISTPRVRWTLGASFSYNRFKVVSAEYDALEAAETLAVLPPFIYGARTRLSAGPFIVDAVGDNIYQRASLAWNTPLDWLRVNVSGYHFINVIGVVAGVSFNF